MNEKLIFVFLFPANNLIPVEYLIFYLSMIESVLGTVVVVLLLLCMLGYFVNKKHERMHESRDQDIDLTDHQHQHHDDHDLVIIFVFHTKSSDIMMRI